MFWKREYSRLAAFGFSCLVAGIGLGGISLWLANGFERGAGRTDTLQSSDEKIDTSETILEFPMSLWEPASLKIDPVHVGELAQTLQLTAKITLNSDHVAHIHPMVEGRVDQVNVKFGQRVKKGDTLVVIQSREIGQANLTLYQDRVLRESAAIKNEWNQDVARNTRSLIEAIKSNTPIGTIESLFKSKIIGSYREKLLSAYVNLNKSMSDLDRMRTLAEKDAIANKQLLAADAVFNADRATLQALLEQLDQEAQYAAILSAQAVREAETRVRIDETNFRILGYSDFLSTDIDLQKTGDSLGQFPITAPFDGTIISKDVVLMERANPTIPMLTLADLSTVWIATDVYEQHLPLIKNLMDSEIIVRTPVWPDREFRAKVFYTGEIVDETSRTIGMRAIADNEHGLLKPGMFVNVEIPGIKLSNIVQVPSDAILDHEGKTFVFVHLGGSRFQKRSIIVGRAGQLTVEISSGLKPGEQVVTQGGFALKSKLLEDLVAGE